jgi:hypothetical protein
MCCAALLQSVLLSLLKQQIVGHVYGNLQKTLNIVVICRRNKIRVGTIICIRVTGIVTSVGFALVVR